MRYAEEADITYRTAQVVACSEQVCAEAARDFCHLENLRKAMQEYDKLVETLCKEFDFCHDAWGVMNPFAVAPITI